MRSNQIHTSLLVLCVSGHITVSILILSLWLIFIIFISDKAVLLDGSLATSVAGIQEDNKREEVSLCEILSDSYSDISSLGFGSDDLYCHLEVSGNLVDKYDDERKENLQIAEQNSSSEIKIRQQSGPKCLGAFIGISQDESFEKVSK